MKFKTLLNSCFLLILPNKKKEKNKYLKNRKAKVGAIFSKDIFLIIMFDWLIFCFLRISINICGKDYIKKNRGYNLGPNIIKRDKKADNLDRKVDNLSTSIINMKVD